MKAKEVTEKVYIVGSSDLSDSRDCSVYLIDAGDLVLVDAGAGPGFDRIVSNIKNLGFDPGKISTLILTHCHIDHVGGAHFFKEKYGPQIVMHDLDARVVERGDQRMTAAFYYNINFKPLPVDIKFAKEEEHLSVCDHDIVCLHTPGHTPGSMSVYLDIGGKRVLFGQDIHGPFMKDFGSDLRQYRESMEKLLALKADVLCEGHFGVYQPAVRVADYIERYLDEYGE
ncbi:MAG TPA: MBL fold metallo-hydrolase [Syntrophorhabdaceae bacterium]|jgi:glyoxylase-like metal-dependent hydrolase (beta-lactamase superfamily II)